MKKVLIIFLSGLALLTFLGMVTFVILPSSNQPSSGTSNLNDSDMQDHEIPINEQEGTLQGYYFNGYIDMRDSFEGGEESDYFHNMDYHFDFYRNQAFVHAKDEPKEDYVEYFKQLDPLNALVSFRNKTKVDLQNGDYIKVTFKGGIMESYPAQIGEVVDVVVIDRRK
ncbi:DUF3221 domain-containing protein [Oceanobacillus kimchii]|uniref:DUF3221 domain-containing protein n=1 Tax=Oceanobacillus kimchii TaxID=746691 RepID=UPI0009879962|nr:DUF3221 domain-containing protein [Oceanobacillus kimchii]MCT1578780.1 DUF3221 domain-containing protein [Oceanobacillus kimchii]MCT2137770.1 DUF3221 domain-containing protein [Oceanobacillus kimchii]